jgi:hypothetical protein
MSSVQALRSKLCKRESKPMKLLKTVLASAVLVASAGANAAVTGSLGGGLGTFATLSSPTIGVPGTGGTLSGAVTATINGGTVFAADFAFADDVLPGENFLAAGPTPGGFVVPNTSTLTFAGAGVSYISFLWGSPDTYNTLTVNSTGSSQVFTAAGLGFPFTNGDQSFNQSVQFTGLAGSLITSLVFSSTQDAFEVARFSITAVPEPETYAMMLAGLGLMGFVARRRKQRAA